MAPSDATTRVLESFGFTFPPVGIAVIVYALLGDPVFAVNRFIGFRLHRGLRVGLRRLYLLCNCAFFALLSGAVLWGCSGAPPPGPDGATGVCGARPLHERACLASVVVAVGHLRLLCDRVFVPLLSVEDHVGFACWRRRLAGRERGRHVLALGRRPGAAVALAGVLAAPAPSAARLDRARSWTPRQARAHCARGPRARRRGGLFQDAAPDGARGTGHGADALMRLRLLNSKPTLPLWF